MSNKDASIIKQFVSVTIIILSLFIFSCETAGVYIIKPRHRQVVVVTPSVSQTPPVLKTLPVLKTPPVLKVKPAVVLIPESDVYVCVEHFDGIDVFFVDGVWWCYYNGVWWKTTSVGTSWVLVETTVVPKVLLTLPPGWKNKVLSQHTIQKQKVQKEIKVVLPKQKGKRK